MKKYKDGIYENMPMSEYLSLPCFSKSMAGHLLKSPLHFKYYMEHKDEFTSDRMDFGNVVDCLLFEPKDFENRFFMTPETYLSSDGKTLKNWNTRSKTCQSIMATHRKMGRIPLDASDFDRAAEIVKSIHRHPMASSWLNKGQTQLTLIWTDPDTGISCKGRIDWICPKKTERIVDLKVTSDPTPNAFRRIAQKFFYDIQSAMYHDGLSFLREGQYPLGFPIPCSLIVAEDNPPYDVVCYDVSTRNMGFGRASFREAIRKYQVCLEQNRWQGFSDFAEDLEYNNYTLQIYEFDGIIER